MDSTMKDNMQSAIGEAEKTILVHKEHQEGALVVNALTGIIISPPDERPEWSEGLAAALTGERYKFYLERLGPDYVASTLKNEEAVAFEDLGWLAIDVEGDPIELEADVEWRMTKIAEYAGILRTDDLEQEQPVTGSKVTEVFVDMGTTYDAEEAHALEKAQADTFPAVKTGTNAD